LIRLFNDEYGIGMRSNDMGSNDSGSNDMGSNDSMLWVVMTMIVVVMHYG
jgi:hypothetical protein